MPGLEPEIMVVDSLYQDRTDTAAIGAKGIGEDLVAHQRRPGCRDLVFFQALTDALGKGLFRVGDAIHTIVIAEDLHPVFMAVGHHAYRNIRSKDVADPGIHLLRRKAGGIGDDGIVKIQHQQFDPLLFQKFRGQVCEFPGDHSRQQ